MKFHTRLLLCAVLPAALFTGAVSIGLWGLVRTQNDFDRYMRTEQAAANGFFEMYAQGLQMGQALRNIVLDPTNRKAYDNLAAAGDAYTKAREQTMRAVQGRGLDSALRDIEQLRDTHAQQQQRVLSLVASDAAAAAKALNSDETPAWRQLRAALLKQIDAGREAAEAANADVKQRAQSATRLSIALALLAIGVALSMLWLLRRTLAQEVGGEPAVAREALRRIADGDLSDAGAALSQQGLMGELQRTRQRLRELVAEVQKIGRASCRERVS
jgi:methyl-accepting chemotaxis protein